MATPRKYIPETEGLNREFFLQCASGVLHVQRCDSCQRYRHPPRYFCNQCFSDQWSWVASPGLGVVASWVTTSFTVDAGWVDEVPYTTVVVELDEGPRLIGAMRNMSADRLAIGTPVHLVEEVKRDDFVFFWVEPQA